jgi:hypothetical protein
VTGGSSGKQQKEDDVQEIMKPGKVPEGYVHQAEQRRLFHRADQTQAGRGRLQEARVR